MSFQERFVSIFCKPKAWRYGHTFHDTKCYINYLKKEYLIIERNFGFWSLNQMRITEFLVKRRLVVRPIRHNVGGNPVFTHANLFFSNFWIPLNPDSGLLIRFEKYYSAKWAKISLSNCLRLWEMILFSKAFGIFHTFYLLMPKTISASFIIDVSLFQLFFIVIKGFLIH